MHTCRDHGSTSWHRVSHCPRTYQFGWVGQSGSARDLPVSTGIISMPPCLALKKKKWVLGIQVRSPYFPSKHFTDWLSHLPISPAWENSSFAYLFTYPKTLHRKGSQWHLLTYNSLWIESLSTSKTNLAWKEWYRGSKNTITSSSTTLTLTMLLKNSEQPSG